MLVTIDLAARHLLLHFDDVAVEFAFGGDRRQVLPVAEDHRQRRQRRAEFMRRTRRQQPHAHDVLLLDGALAQLGQARVAFAQNAADAREEHHQQARHQQEADQQALHVVIGQAACGFDRECDGRRCEREPGDAECRRRRDHPAPRRAQDHRAQHHLQQVEEDERIGDAAGEVQLDRERCDIHQQRNEQCVAGCVFAPAPPPLAEDVEQRERAQHRDHRFQRQADAQAVMHDEDRRDLPDHRDRAQLDQLLHVAQARAAARAWRGGPGLRFVDDVVLEGACGHGGAE